jgi:hypothetical protein
VHIIFPQFPHNTVVIDEETCKISKSTDGEWKYTGLSKNLPTTWPKLATLEEGFAQIP